MRRFMLIFLMIFLPLQWSSAAVAGCCARASTSAPPAAEAHTLHMMSDMVSADMHHHHQAKAKDKAADKAVQHDCDAGCQNCPDCHAHAAFVLLQRASIAAMLPHEQLTSRYLSFMSDVLPDNLYRPPLNQFA